MRFKSTGTRRQTVLARPVPGLLALVWLNLAAQPCVMAASTPPDDATQGAPMPAAVHDGAETAHAAHRRVATTTGAHEICTHCAGSGHQSCSNTVQCTGIDAISAELAVKLDDAPAALWVAAASARTWNVLPIASESAITALADPPASGPTLNVRYCEYQI